MISKKMVMIARVFLKPLKIALILGACSPVLSISAAPQPVDEALPMVGTAGHGHTYPGATVPFGFVQLSPDTRTEGWDACSGYNYVDTSILGFSHNHLSGTGGADLGNLLLMPVTGELNTSNGYASLNAERFASDFSHDDEVAQPGYYRVLLGKYNILAELTATAHSGMHRYTFPASDQSHILIDLVHGIGNQPMEAGLTIESDRLVTGFRFDNGWSKGRTLYFALEFSRPFAGFGLEVDEEPLPAGQTNAAGKNVRGHLDYQTLAGQQIIVRVGLSPTSVEEAKKNLQAEIPGWDFDAVRKSARNLWNENLSRIRIESPSPAIRQTFYSALYHTMSAPTLYNNADGSYPGADRKVHDGDGFQYYQEFSLWDTFRAENPLMTLVEPDRVNDFVRSLLAFYQQSSNHVLPRWPLASWETGAMIGYHAVPVIVDAYQKGFRGFDTQLAWQAIRDTAMSGANRQDEYQRLGYVPFVAAEKRTKENACATARTLEFAYDDWCIAQMAKALGKTDDATVFTKRAEYYKNVWDPATRFFRSKQADGTYFEPFDPTEVAKNNVAEGYYVEANAWEYAFFVPQDVPGMIQLYGGNEAFVNRLDQFFDMDSDINSWRIDVSGLIGQYAHGNEPCHQIAYLYALAGVQYKTAARVRQIMQTQYDNSPDGLCGNDDCGQISAWYVWSAMGLYPVNPASGIYVIGSPMVEQATIQLNSQFYKGGTFTITTHSDARVKSYANDDRLNVYVQSALLNGKPLNRPWITHEEIVSGGTLELEMGVLPNKAWGTAN
jgi:predicted alpha-1,2-mannosidase